MHKVWIYVSGAAFAAGATIATVTWHQPRGHVAGLTLVLMAAMAAMTQAVCRQIGKQGRDVEAAYEMGHAAGYREGRRVARPVVVPHPTLGQWDKDEGGSHARATAAVWQVAGDGAPARREAADLHGAAEG